MSTKAEAIRFEWPQTPLWPVEPTALSRLKRRGHPPPFLINSPPSLFASTNIELSSKFSPRHVHGQHSAAQSPPNRRAPLPTFLLSLGFRCAHLRAPTSLPSIPLNDPSPALFLRSALLRVRIPLPPLRAIHPESLQMYQRTNAPELIPIHRLLLISE